MHDNVRMANALAAIAAHLFLSNQHTMQKFEAGSITLVAGVGVSGDAHAGATVKHRSRVAADPTQPNLRQVHLIHGELHDELRARGFDIAPGRMGENITTRGVDLLALPVGALLRIGAAALIGITGLRNPCSQIDGIQPGLLAAVLDHAPDGTLIRKAGVMGVVLQGGVVRIGDPITISLPPAPHRSLERV
jgi:MOSC domain-containing protein YiiM